MENTPTQLSVREYAMLTMEVDNRHLYKAVLQILKNKGLVHPSTRLQFGTCEDATNSGSVAIYKGKATILLYMRNFGAFTQLIASSEIELMDDDDPETQEYYSGLIVREVIAVLNRDSVSL